MEMGSRQTQSELAGAGLAACCYRHPGRRSGTSLGAAAKLTLIHRLAPCLQHLVVTAETQLPRRAHYLRWLLPLLLLEGIRGRLLAAAAAVRRCCCKMP